ncbi:hypothetical protein SAMN05216244_1660 [Sediminibacillus halophilus]|uniref:Uncharacterized protein n=1 Tax=Sediminibacillus halophilus TaxID=482461 RepID=A0A1G9QTP8_9BACI|nr:hypothetical protein SAMN05216244_1660 [Sediminibacillus halophilus]
MERFYFNLALILLVIFYTVFVLFSVFFNDEYISNNLKRTKNGFRRFINRIKSLWPMNLFFIIIFTVIVILNLLIKNFQLESYLTSLFSLIITVYLLDFLYSEQGRRETANKRYTVDWEFHSIYSELEFGLHRLLIPEEDVYYGLDPDGDYNYRSMNLHTLDSESIAKIIKREGFWNKKTDHFQSKGYKIEITNRDFLTFLLSESRIKVNNHLIRYSNLILYEDFKLIHKLDNTLNDFYLKKGSNFPNLNQDMVAYSLEGLISCIFDCHRVKDKWK